jgi:2-amino-4-hydroxy-6-hydroxymethyldihydropteridine diphosphokinase
MERMGEYALGRVSRSSLWWSRPVDCPEGSRRFLNAAVSFVAREGETPESLLRKLQALEREFGREPKQVLNEARLLDLDLIAFGDEVRSTVGLTLPHPRAHLRRFVLEPLNEIAGGLRLPGQERTVRELLAGLGGEEWVMKWEPARKVD